jgi:outer membrane immunogenic protein
VLQIGNSLNPDNRLKCSLRSLKFDHSVGGTQMRKIAFAAAALALSGSAYAADMPLLKAPPMAVPVADWSGYYFGGHVGGYSLRDPVSDLELIPGFNAFGVTSTISKSGFDGGAQYGYMKQFSSVVFGFESDFSWLGNASGATTGPNLFGNGLPTGSGGVAWTTKVNWLTSDVLRLGYVVMPNVMIFATGGVAAGDVSGTAQHAYTGGCPNCSNGSFSKTDWGITAGAGVEFMLSDHWLLRGEYKYYQLSGNTAVGVQQANPALIPSSFGFGNTVIQVGSAAVSYKF